MVVAENKSIVEIRRRIKERDLTQGELGKKIGRSQGWVSSRLLSSPLEAITHLIYKDPRGFRLLMAALGWTIEQLNEATGLNISESGMLEAQSFPADVVMLDVVGRETPLPVRADVARSTAQAYKMPDNSMDDGSADAIREGDWVLVDFADVTPVNGRRYLISNVKGLCVRRLLRVGDAWIWAADNIEAASLQGSAANIEGACYTVLSYRSL